MKLTHYWKCHSADGCTVEEIYHMEGVCVCVCVDPVRERVRVRQTERKKRKKVSQQVLRLVSVVNDNQFRLVCVSTETKVKNVSTFSCPRR